MSDSDSNNLIDAFEISDDDYAPAAKKTKAPPAAKKPAQKKPAAPKATKAKAGGSGPAKRLSDKENGDDAADIFETIDHATQGGRKSLSVEQIYQRLSQLDHVLVRPDTYIGSVEKHTEAMWVYNMEAEKFDYREITYVPGFYKIFDEILVNAADNKQRDRHMNTIRITIDKEKNEIAIYNNGKGVPVVEHKYEKMYVPELIFGTLLTSSNYDDSDKKVTGGRNGYGAKLCNIFSKKFVVETSCRDSKHSFKQTWTNNMNKDVPAHKIKKPDIGDAKNDDFTKVTFQPDLKRFGMDHFEKDMVDLMARRAFDIAGSCKGVRVFLNNKRLPCVGFKEYVNTFVKDMVDEHGEHMKVEYEACGSRWEVGVTHSDSGFKQISFVNSIATTKGGRHVDHVVDQLIKKLIEHIKAKLKKSGTQLRPHQVKQHLFVFVNCLIENPAFDSQTKETMTLQAKNFGSKCEISDKFIKNVIKNLKVVDNIMSWVRFKQQDQLDKKCHTTKHTKLKGVPKLEDANNAGTKRSTDCVLILTEGDSAKSLAVSGLGVVGRDNYGVFPLRGKMLNVRDASHKQQLANEEVNNLIKILGLQFKKNYATENDYKSLRYGKIMIMADQDQDGSHIKGLIINFVHHFWPSLVRQQNFVEEFITPIVKVQKGNQEQSFYSLPEYEDWKRDTPNWHLWRIKYYKGLGTSTSKEAKEYFSDMRKNRIAFKYRQGDDDAIEMAFSKNKIEERKNWLTNWMEERKRRKELGLGEVYLYEKDTRAISYRDFVDKELVLFSNLDNERSIPSMVDGLKPGQRKVMFTCFKRNLKKEIKVAQLAGSVAEHSAYHHGEASLMSTIIGLAQDFVGSNNINLLTPNGQFGTRLQGGKDAASPRYIFTALSPLARVIFHEHDDAVLRFLRDDNQRIEPEWYCPCVPMVLINGADGIGTGWSTRVLNYNPMDVVQNLRRLLRDEDPKAMKPWFKNFRGHIEKLGDRSVAVSGVVSTFDDGQTMEVTELPIRMWTEAYKTGTLEPMLTGSEKIQPVITDFKEYHTDTTVRFVVKAPQATLAMWLREGLHKTMKLSSTMSTNNMVLFDADGVLRRYETELDILKDFYIVRLRKYDERRAFLIGKLGAEAKKLSEQARFIMLKIKGEISLENKKKRDIVKQLIEHKFARDPVKAWTEEYTKKRNEAEGSLESADEDAEEADEDDVPTEADKKVGEAAIKGYEYLVNQYLIKLSWEEKEKLEKERDEKQSELRTVESKTAKDLWSEDLDRFEMEYKKEIDRQQEEASSAKVATLSSAATKAGKGGAKKGRKVDVAETRPSKDADEVDPDIGYLKAKVEETTRRAEDKKLGIVSGRGKKKKEEESLMSRIEKRRESQGKSKPSPSIKRYLKAPGEQKPKEELLDSDIEMVEDDDAPAASKPVKRPAKHDDEDSASKKRKKTTKEPWETDEEDEEVDISEDSDDGSEVVPVNRARRERKPVKYDVDADVELEDVNGATGSNQQSDEESSSKPSTSKPPSSRNSLFDDGISDADNKPVTAKQKKKPMVIEDDESDYKSDDDKPKQKAKGKGRPKKAVASDSEDSEYDDFIAKSDEDEVPRKKSPPPKAKPSSKPAANQKARKESDSEDNFLAQSDEDDEDFTPEKKPAAKTKAAAKSGPAAKKPVANGTKLKQFEFDADSDDNSDSRPADKPTTSDAVCDLFDSPSPSPSPVKVTKKAAAKKKRVVSSESEGGDSDFRADSPVERLVADRPGRTARATKKVDYNVDEAGSDSE